MKYYDGFGKDVTDYVENLQLTVKLLKEKLDKLEPVVVEEPESVEEYEPEIGGEKEIIEKPKRKRRQKIENANSQ
jgi:hypothetical protein